MKLWKILAVPALIMGSFGCKEDMECPCHDKLRTKGDYGVGTFDINMRDNTHLVKECGFEFVDNHRGGYGDTLQEIGCNNNSMHFIWAYGGLDSITVREGWEGRTDTGLKIGSSIEDYLEKYPESRLAMVGDPNSYISPHFITRFNDDGYIDRMTVTWFNYKNQLERDNNVYGCVSDATLYTKGEEERKSGKTYEHLGLGEYKINMPNNLSLVNNCGFRYTYTPDETMRAFSIIGGENESVWMEWSINDLMRVSVREGWKGETERGLRIGDTRERFLKLYPGAKEKDVSLYGDYEIWTAGFLKTSIDKQGKVDMLELDRYNHNNTGYDWTIPVYPWQKEPIWFDG